MKPSISLLQAYPSLAPCLESLLSGLLFDEVKKNPFKINV
jgi:hypothetical protein